MMLNVKQLSNSMRRSESKYHQIRANKREAAGNRRSGFEFRSIITALGVEIGP